jgi:hypothetical protein
MSYVGTVGAAGNLSTFTMTLPAVANDDVLFLFVAHTNTVTINSVTPASTSRSTTTEGGLVVDVYTRTMVSTDSGTTLTVSTSAVSKTAVGGIIFRGVDISDPMANTVIEHDQTTTRTSPPVTLTETTDVISFIAERTAAGTTTSFTAPAGVTKVQDQVNTSTAPNNLALGYVAAVAASTVGPYSWTVNGGVTTARRVGITVGVNAIGGVAPPRTLQYVNSGGTAVSIASAKYLNAAGTLVDLPSWVTS